MNSSGKKLSFHMMQIIIVLIKYFYKSGVNRCLIVTLLCKPCWTTGIEWWTTILSNGTRWQDVYYDAIPYKLSVRLNGVFLGPVMASNLLWTPPDSLWNTRSECHVTCKRRRPILSGHPNDQWHTSVYFSI